MLYLSFFNVTFEALEFEAFFNNVNHEILIALIIETLCLLCFTSHQKSLNAEMNWNLFDVKFEAFKDKAIRKVFVVLLNFKGYSYED